MNIQKKISILVFALLLIIGCKLVLDYGVGWDEEAQITIGKTSFNYISKGDPTLFSFHDRDYGVGFELPVYVVQRIFKTDAEQYYFRHYCIHLLFLIGLFFLYKAQLIFYKKNKYLHWISLLTILLIVLSPRIYADSFFNSKDIVLLAISCINFYTLIRAIDSPSIKNWVLHALCSAYLLDVRIIGIINVVLAILIIIYKLIIDFKQWKIYLNYLLLYVTITSITLYAIWPYLYKNPIQNFIVAFNNMKHFRWIGDVMFMGKTINTTNLPWYYAFVWIGITTPIFYLISFFIGLAFTLKSFFNTSFFTQFNNTQKMYLLITCALALGPLVAVVLFKSVLYDAWRQLFYIYPYIIILSVFGFYSLFNIIESKPILKISITLLLIAQLYSVIYFMVKNHPYQNVYFNELPSKEKNYLVKNFERDYWGVSYKQALQYLCTKIHSNTDTIKVLVANTPGKLNAAFLTPILSKQLLVYRMDESNDSIRQTMDYFITTFRGASHLYPKCHPKVWSISVQQSDVISIFDIRKNKNCYD